MRRDFSSYRGVDRIVLNCPYPPTYTISLQKTIAKISIPHDNRISLDSKIEDTYCMDMSLLKYLTTETVTPELKGTNKKEIIEELLDIICKTGKVKDREVALEAILARENKMSTGMENEIAIPHGKTDAVEELVACVGISKKPIEFNSLDGKPCRIFIMTISPSHRTGPHIQFLSEISTLLRSESKRKRLLEAKDPQTILQVLSESS